MSIPSFYKILALVFCLCTYLANGQVAHKISPIKCQVNPENFACYVAPPAAFVNQAMEIRSDFIFSFDAEVPAAARTAMEYAASIWASRLTSLVPIEISVNWQTFEEESVLASAGPTSIYRDFLGAAKRNTWYPVALAEALASTNFNDNEADIQITANSDQRWYYGLDGQVPRGQIDMVSVILHELGHGLGFLSSANVNEEDLGELGFGTQFIIFDTFIETNAGNQITDRSQFSNPSTTLRTAYTSNALFFSDPIVASLNSTNDPKLHAPRTFDQGSSISHLDETVFNTGSENALMSPQLSFQEAIHDPGPVSLAIMEAIGWDVFVGTVTSTQELLTETLEVFPNPARTSIQIKWPIDLNAQVNYQLMNSLGQTLQYGTVFPQEALDVSQLTAGTYFLQLQAGARTFVSQVVVVD